MDVQPVAGDVDDHGELEEEHEARVECGEGAEESHGSAPISQHVQHGSKLAALAQQPRHVTVQGVQQAGDDVAPGGRGVVGRHEPEAEQGQHDPPVPDKVGHEEEHILGLSSEGFLELRGHLSALLLSQVICNGLLVMRELS